MKSRFQKIVTGLISLFVTPAIAHAGNTAQANGIELWYETFGDKRDPALLLLMGGSCQGVLWSTQFCERLAEEGFYVVRYDHRDTGLSTCMDFQKSPYDLLDVTKDAVGLLDYLAIDKAHLFGLSMGGIVAQIMAAHFPEKVWTIAVIGSTPDVRPMNLAIQNKSPEEGALSSPVKEYSTWRGSYPTQPYDQDITFLEHRIDIWHKLSGFAAPFDEDHFRSLFRETLIRLKNVDCLMNHFLASACSEEIVRDSSKNIHVPTLIFQGSEEPVFRPDHGMALARLIPESEYVLVNGMGHVPTPYFEEFIIKKLKQHTSSR